RDLSNDLRSKLTGIEVSPTTFPGVVARAGMTTAGAVKLGAAIQTDLNDNFSLILIQFDP
ncbi:hypothetical protein SAMN05216571_1151, partial [Onishia taeanensis]